MNEMMMNQPSKFHVTNNGPRPCTASKRSCRYSHFDSMEEAEQAFARRMEEAQRSNISLRLLSKSKALSKALRHDPSIVGETFQENGYIPVEPVLKRLKLTREELDIIVAQDSKGRYAYNGDRTLIRAVQGHSAAVKIDLQRTTPPAVLYHGTMERVLDPIMAQGLKPMRRQYVHLSSTVDTASNVAARRRGGTVILEIDARAMAKDGVEFFLSENGVWLTKAVPPKYIKVS